jgi:Immunity protein 26
MKNKKEEPLINVGDIYSFPVEEKFGIVQIVKIPDESTLTIIVFEKLFKPEKIDLNNLDNEKILFFGTTFDGRIYNKLWNKIGNYQSNLKSIKFPYYKIGLSEKYRIEDYDGKFIRNAKEDEIDKLNYKNITDSLPFEKMFKKYHGLLDEEYEYDKSLYSYVLESIELVEGKQNKPKFWK